MNDGLPLIGHYSPRHRKEDIPMAKKQPKLVLIDAHALIHRAYHALPPMNTSKGVPTNAVYGFTAMLLKVLTVIKPTHVVAAFDVKGPTFRHIEFKAYKAHRPKADDDLVVQFDLVRAVVRAFNIPVLEKKGFEADDIIGTLARGFNHGVKKIIVTGDMDTLQLIDDFTSVFTLKRGATDTVTYDEAAVRERFGFGPQLIPDYKGLAGDPSDNIPGVAGIGAKTAQELVGKYGAIEKIYEHLEELPTRARTRLTGQEKAALQSRGLATIRCDVPLAFELPDSQLDDYDVAEVKKVFAQLEFKAFLQRLPSSARESKQLRLGETAKDDPVFPMPEHYHLVADKASQKKLHQELLREKVIAVDTETERLGARTEPIVGMSFAVSRGKETEAWYVPTDPTAVKEWQELLESPKVAKVGHNIKYDMEVFAQSGIALGPVTFDTMIASYLLQSDSRQYSLDALALSELQHTTIPITDLIGTGKEQRKMSEVPLNNIAVYAAEDAWVTWRLYEQLTPRITEQGLTRVFEEIEMPLIPVLSIMELTGVKLNTKALAEMGRRVRQRITKVQKKIWEAAGEEFNVNSTKQLRRILYEKLSIATDTVMRKQTGYSTAASELLKLRDKHIIIPLLEEYRELTKLLNTYIVSLPQQVDARTGRIYTSFNQTIAATGRLSSTDPNLQNIPARTQLGQEIRAAFIADRGKALVKADYSQLELRIAAHISQDEKMLEAFRFGQDIHRATAAWVYGIPQEEVTDTQRRAAKTLNFGVLYGMGARAFAQSSRLSLEQARSFIERYREQYWGIAQLIQETISQAQLQEYVETLYGRRRYVPEINARSPMVRSQAERIAFNFPIQGTESDILKKAMIALQEKLEKNSPDSRMVLTVHDELVVEAPKAEVKKVAKLMKDSMENVITLDVPLTVDVSSGLNWRDVAPVKL